MQRQLLHDGPGGRPEAAACTAASVRVQARDVSAYTVHLARRAQDAFGLEQCTVVTMQAVSGAGYPGVASMDILDNVVPYISGEEDKVV